VFWTPGSVTLNGTTIASDTPAVAWLTDDGATLTVNAADPAQGTGSITLTVSGNFKSGSGADPGVTVALTSTAATVSVGRAGGVTHTASLALSEPTAPDGGALSTLTGSDGGDAGSVEESPDGATTSHGSPASAKGGCGCRTAGRQVSGGIFDALGIGLFVLAAGLRRSGHLMPFARERRRAAVCAGCVAGRRRRERTPLLRRE